MTNICEHSHWTSVNDLDTCFYCGKQINRHPHASELDLTSPPQEPSKEDLTKEQL